MSFNKPTLKSLILLHRQTLPAQDTDFPIILVGTLQCARHNVVPKLASSIANLNCIHL